MTLQTRKRARRPSRMACGLVGLSTTLCVAALAAVLAPPVAIADARSDLAAVEAKVATQFPQLTHLEPSALAAMMAANQPLVLFDVREDAEFQISHLTGARRVTPDTDPLSFAASVASEAKGKAVVFYCSVGMRSSRLASTASQLLMNAGAASVSNLRGGIFRWSNEGRPLEKGPGTGGKASNTNVGVHPYNATWGRLIESPQQPKSLN